MKERELANSGGNLFLPLAAASAAAAARATKDPRAFITYTLQALQVFRYLRLIPIYPLAEAAGALLYFRSRSLGFLAPLLLLVCALVTFYSLAPASFCSLTLLGSRALLSPSALLSFSLSLSRSCCTRLICARALARICRPEFFSRPSL